MKLKDYMDLKKIAIEDAAAAIGVATSSFYRYVDGRRFPRPDRLKRITEWSKGAVTANDFLDFSEDDDDDDAPGTPSKGPAKMAAGAV